MNPHLNSQSAERLENVTLRFLSGQILKTLTLPYVTPRRTSKQCVRSFGSSQSMGERFKGSETGRKGALRKLLERTFEDLRKKLGRPPTTPEFLDSLRAKAAEEFDDRPDTKRARIIDVDEGKNICWSYGGREKSITYKRLRNIRTELSKNFFLLKVPVFDKPR